MADTPQNTSYSTGGASQNPPTSTPKYQPWAGVDPSSGVSWGFSDQKDVSGLPYLAYRLPGADATTTDPTRVAPSFNPLLPAMTTLGQLHTPRLDASASAAIKSQMNPPLGSELDHAIPLELAGSNNPSNLRIEPGFQTPGGESSGFDQEENALAGQVQSGQMSLFAAQLKMALDKAAAGDKNYIPFVGTNNPTPIPSNTITPYTGKPNTSQAIAAQPGQSATAPKFPWMLGAAGAVGASSAAPQTAPITSALGTNRSIPQANKFSLFQSDYIVPPWAGGTNSAANRVTMPTPLYDLKNKIQSVPYTLYSNGLISKQDALSMAVNWQHINNSGGIPTPNYMGMIPVDTAQQIYKEWQTGDLAKPPLTLGSVLRSVPEAANNLGKGWLPEWARQFIVGAASGITGGAVPLNSSPGATAIDKIAGLAGEGAGAFAAIFALGGLTDLAGAALSRTVIGRALGGAATEAGITAAAGETAGATAGGESVFAPMLTGEATQAAKTSSTIGNILSKVGNKVNPRTAMAALSGDTARAIVGKALKNAVVFGEYGQLGQFGQGFTTGQQATLSDHIGQLANDLVLGGITGYFPNTWKGAAYVGGAVTSLGLMSGESPRTSLANGLAFAALHKVGGFARDTAAEQAMQKTVLDNNVAKGAFTVLHTFVGDKELPGGIPGVPKINLRGAAPALDTYTPAQVDAWGEQAIQNLRYMGVKNTSVIGKDVLDSAKTLAGTPGELTPEQYVSARNRILAAVKYLKDRQLPPDMQERQAVLDLTSISRQLGTRYNVPGVTMPNTVLPFVNKLDTTIPGALDARPDQNFSAGRWQLGWGQTQGEGAPANNGLRGEMRLTGQGSNFSNSDRMNQFIEDMRSGKAAPYIVLANQPEMAPFFRDLNRSVSDSQIKNGEAHIDQNPENYVNAFYFTKDPNTGKYVVRNLGARAPSKWRIGEFVTGADGKETVVGGKHAFNNDIGIQTGQWARENPNFNKDTLAVGMRSRNTPILMARVHSFLGRELPEGRVGKQQAPYVIVRIGDNEWDMSQKVWQALGAPQEFNSPEENIAMAMAQRGKTDITPYVDKAAQQLSAEGTNAPSIIERTPLEGVNAPRQQALFELTSKAHDIAVESHTPEEVKQQFQTQLGLKLTDTEASQIEASRDTMTGGDMLRVADKAIAEGRAEPLTAASFTTYVKPLMQSKAFQETPAGLLLDRMPLVNKAEAGNVRVSKLSRAPQSDAVAQTKQTIRQELETQLSTIFDNFQPRGVIGRRLQRGDIIRELRDQINGIGTNSRDLTPQEYNAVKREVLSGASGRAMDVVHSMVPPSEEASYLSGSPFEQGADKQTAEAVVEADTARRLGLYDDMRNILSSQSPEALDIARKTLFPKMIGETDEEWNSRTGWMLPENQTTASPEQEAARSAYFKENVPEATKAGGTQFFNEVKGGITSLPKDSYGYAFYKTFWDGLQKSLAHSKEPIEANYDLMRFFSEANQVGRSFMKQLFSTIDDRTGMPISQPKTRIAKMAAGAHGAELAAESTARAQELAQEGPESQLLPSTMIGHGMKAETPSQSSVENYKDLTRMEAQVTPGRIALEGGVDKEGKPLPPISETEAGIRDGQGLLQFLMKNYNQYLRAERSRGGAQGAGRKTASLMNFVPDSEWGKIGSSIKEESRVAGLMNKAQEEIASLKKQTEAITEVGGSRARTYLSRVAEQNNARIKQLEDFINNTKTPAPTPKVEKTVETTPAKETYTTYGGQKLGKEKNPDGSYWLEQNKTTNSFFANLAKKGHEVKWLFLPGGKGYEGKVSIDGKIYKDRDTARAAMAGGGKGGPGYPALMSALSPAGISMPGSSPSQSWPQYLGGLSSVNNQPQDQSKLDIQPTENLLRGVKSPADFQQLNQSPIKISPAETTSTLPKQPDNSSIFPNAVFNAVKQFGQRTANAANDVVASAIGERPTTYNKPGGFPQTANPVIAGVDTGSYATDPNHAKAIRNIISLMQPMGGAQDYDSYIHKLAPKSPITGQMIANAATYDQLSPAEVSLLIASMQQDSMFGTKGMARKTLNPGNVGNTGSKSRTYKTWEDGVRAVANFIAQNRLKQNGPAHVTDPSLFADRLL